MSAPADKLFDELPPSVSLGRMFAVLRKRLWLIIGTIVVIPTVVGAVVSKQPKQYQARSTLVIESSVPQYLGATFRDVVDVGTNWWTSMETMHTELRILQSHSQALAVTRSLCDRRVPKDDKSAFTRFLPGARCEEPKDLDRVARLLQVGVLAEPVKDSRIVTLTVVHHDPEIAALVANAAAEVYTQRNLERRLSQSEGAATWLGDEYGDLAQQLNEAEHALVEFKKENNVVTFGIEDQQNDLSNRRKKLGDELNSIQIKLIAVRAQREQHQVLKSSDPMNDVSPGVADSPVMQKLKELYVDQYAKLLELRGKYLEKHPSVIAQEARVGAIRDDMRREAGLAFRAVEAQFQTLLKQERDLRASLDSATRDQFHLDQTAIDYNRLKRSFDRLSKLSDQVGGRERETSLAGHLKTNNVRVLDAALVPTSATAPNIPKAFFIALAFALLLAIGLAYALEVLDSTVKSQDDIEKSLGISFLGIIPLIDPGAKSGEVPPPQGLADLVRNGSRDLFVLTHPRSSVAECCKAIRTNLLFMSPDQPSKSLLVTSAGPQEGKTTAAVNLAITMALSGFKVLIVDTDMRRPRLHKAFGIPGTADGLSRAIVGETEALSMIRETGVPNLWVLPCGASPPNPAELLHADRFKRIIEALTSRFDRVIFDSPPIGVVTDAAILSRLTDGTILVAAAGQTSRDSLARARRQLSGDGNINLLGCILNGLDLAKERNYGYYSYARYGSYYSDDESARPTAKEPSQG